METLQAIYQRHSVRSFTSQELSDEQINTLLKAGMSAPSAVDRRPWEFYVLKSQEAKDVVKEALRFGKFNSPIIIVPCINKDKLIPREHGIVFGTCDLSAVTENILLAAVDLGLGAVWCATYPAEERYVAIQKGLNIPEHLIPFCAIYVGYPNEEEAKIKDKYDANLIHIK